MTISEKFEKFIDNIKMSKETIDKISYRYHRIISKRQLSVFDFTTNGLK